MGRGDNLHGEIPVRPSQIRGKHTGQKMGLKRADADIKWLSARWENKDLNKVVR